MKKYIIQFRVTHGGPLHRLDGTVRAYSEAYAIRQGVNKLIAGGYEPVDVMATETK